MARPRLDDEERRERTVGVRVTAAEAAELRERAQAARLSMGAYLRRSCCWRHDCTARKPTPLGKEVGISLLEILERLLQRVRGRSGQPCRLRSVARHAVSNRHRPA